LPKRKKERKGQANPIAPQDLPGPTHINILRFGKSIVIELQGRILCLVINRDNERRCPDALPFFSWKLLGKAVWEALGQLKGRP